MRSATIENASQDEQQNQKTTTTNNSYIHNFMSILKKNIIITSAKTKN